MIVTRLERTVCCVPFLPGILPTGEYNEATPAYPEPLSARRQDVLRIHTDAGPVGLGMSGPYFGDRDETPPDLIGKFCSVSSAPSVLLRQFCSVRSRCTQGLCAGFRRFLSNSCRLWRRHLH